MRKNKKRKWSMGIIDSSNTHAWIILDKFDPDVNSDLKAELPGPARWRSENKRWMFPLSWETCVGARRVANKHNADIYITPALVEWATNERDRQDTIPDVNSMAAVDLPRVRGQAPDIWRAISGRPFQSVGAAFAARNRSCLIADQPGLGKTIQSIAAVVESGVAGPILVVAPKAAAKLTWPQELARWVPNEGVFVLGSHLTLSQRALCLKSNIQTANHGGERLWVITSPNYLRIRAELDAYGNYVYGEDKRKIINAVGETVMELFDVEWSAVIVDESHQTLAGATGNKKKQSAQRLGLGALTIRQDGLRLALSGTPFRGKESYLWGQLNWLRPDIYRSYWKWVEKHFDVERGRYGIEIGRLLTPESMYAEAKSVMIRRTKAEVAKDLPPKMYGGTPLDASNPTSPIAVWLDMDGKQAKAYSDMKRNAAATVEGGTITANSILAELTRLKQFAGSCGEIGPNCFRVTLPSNKFDWLIEFLDERGINKNCLISNQEAPADLPKIVVASQFSQLIDAFAEGLAGEGIASHKFTGSTSDKERQIIKNDWQDNETSPVRVLLLTTTAGGTSLTLDAADELVILDETWSPSDQEQLEDRLHRLSRMHQVTIWNVRSRGTIEETIARSNLLRNMNIHDIIDGERGVSTLKGLLVK